MRNFKLIREVDISGVSGTGHVAQGVEFDNGKCAVTFVSGPVSSVIAYDNIQDVQTIHGHGGHTKLVFEEDEIEPAEFFKLKRRIVAYENGLGCIEAYIAKDDFTKRSIAQWFSEAREI